MLVYISKIEAFFIFEKAFSINMRLKVREKEKSEKSDRKKVFLATNDHDNVLS